VKCEYFLRHVCPSVQNNLNATQQIVIKHSDNMVREMKEHYKLRGRDSSVGIATRYGLDGPGIVPGGGRNFSHLFIPTKGPTQPPVQRVQVFPVSKGGQCVTFTTNLHLAPRSRKSTAIPLHTFCTVWPATG